MKVWKEAAIVELNLEETAAGTVTNIFEEGSYNDDLMDIDASTPDTAS